MKQLERLLFLQGQRCFFCRQPIPDGEASVEHLVASANGGSNGDENCVACCRAVNSALGSLSIKEKLQVVLNQHGTFQCPRAQQHAQSSSSMQPNSREDEHVLAIIEDLYRRGSARPRKVSTLQNTIAAVFHKKLSEEEVSSLLKILADRRYIIIDEQKVSYALPQRVD